MRKALTAAGMLLAIAACVGEEAADRAAAAPAAATAAPDIATTTFAPALGIDLATFTRSESGLYWKDLTVGTGTEVRAGMRASVMYAGHLPNGSPFDSNTGGAPYAFVAGQGQVIAGFDQGVLGMKVGGRRQLIIPPGLGYGAAGSGPIPPNSILVFTIEVVATS